MAQLACCLRWTLVVKRAGSSAAADKPRQGFPRAMRLLKRAEYEAVYGAGQRRSSAQFAVFFRAQTTHPRSAAGAGAESSREGSRAEALPQAPPAGPGGPQVRETRPASRFGISVKKALGGAVVRNRIRRRVREILRRNKTEIPPGWDIVIHPRPSVTDAPFAPLEAELLRLLKNLPRNVPKT